MIRCDICGEYDYPSEMWIVGPFPLFTYLDNSFCKSCLCGFLRFVDAQRYTIEFDEPYNGEEIWYTNYSIMREDLCKSPVGDERECPICGGIMGEGYNEEWECLSFTCLNCGNEILNCELEMRKEMS